MTSFWFGLGFCYMVHTKELHASASTLRTARQVHTIISSLAWISFSATSYHHFLSYHSTFYTFICSFSAKPQVFFSDLSSLLVSFCFLSIKDLQFQFLGPAVTPYYHLGHWKPVSARCRCPQTWFLLSPHPGLLWPSCHVSLNSLPYRGVCLTLFCKRPAECIMT